METTIVQARAPGFSNSKLMVENTAPQTEVGKNVENETSKIIVCPNEVASEKLKLIVRFVLLLLIFFFPLNDSGFKNRS